MAECICVQIYLLALSKRDPSTLRVRQRSYVDKLIVPDIKIKAKISIRARNDLCNEIGHVIQTPRIPENHGRKEGHNVPEDAKGQLSLTATSSGRLCCL